MNNKKIIIFGTCRLESLSKYDNIIRNNISYTYDTKETLEIIKYLKYNHIQSEQTLFTFRTPMLKKIPLIHKDFEGVLDNTDIFIIEISGRKTYRYNDFYVHSALKDLCKNIPKEDIIINKQNDEEVENDILEIIKELNTKNIIIVGHIVTDNESERYKLAHLLSNICIKYNILFIDPVKEVNKKGYNILNLVDSDSKIIHYNSEGHNIIRVIYEEYINKI